jgi:NOL1/NOP2/sun family putative RNA methylase
MSEVFLKRYKELGQDVKAFKLKQSIRINGTKIDEKKLVKRLEKERIRLTKIPFLDHGYYAEAPFSIGSTPEYLFGYYYIQEAAAQIPVQILDPDEKDLVLDLAAAPGGKTTQIAQCMKNKGAIVAVDNRKDRLHALRNNLERLGITNTLVYDIDGRRIKELKMEFDKILLDAPCSGNFITDPTWFNKRSINGFKERSALQKEMLRAAVSVLKKNGTLVYSTCSMEPEENELVIDWALQSLPIKLEEVKTIGDPGLTTVFAKMLDPDVAKCRRLWPNKTNTQGFFIAKMIKTS